MKKYFFFLCSILVWSIFSNHVQASEKNIQDELIEKLAESDDLTKEYLEKIFSDPRITILKKDISPVCKEKVDYKEKYDRDDYTLLGEKSLALGVEYYNKHKSIFTKAEKKYGVDPFVILSIIRKETYFGNCSGSYYTLATLYDLYKNNRARKNFALKEMGALLELALSNKWNIYSITGSRNIYSITGSYLGAIGYSQFIPSSIKGSSADGNEDGIIDLFSHEDAIMSTARYLSVNNWSINKKKAVWHYNHSWKYVENVFKYAIVMKYATTIGLDIIEQKVIREKPVVKKPTSP